MPLDVNIESASSIIQKLGDFDTELNSSKSRDFCIADEDPWSDVTVVYKFGQPPLLPCNIEWDISWEKQKTAIKEYVTTKTADFVHSSDF